MKKAYETPKAVKYVFDYTENVVASNGKDGKTGPSAASCKTQNGAGQNQGCGGNYKHGGTQAVCS